MKNFSLLLLTLLLTGNLLAQGFEGVITYSITYDQLPAEMQGMEQMLPKSQKILVKGDKTRFEQTTQVSSTIVLSDIGTGTSTILIEAAGQKFKLSMSKEDVDKTIKQQGTPEINYVDGTKEVAGYLCKKAEVTMDGLDEKAIFYYTEEIPPISMRGMENLQLKGMALEYKMSTNGMKMVMMVTDMQKQDISDEMFTVPDGYTEMTDQMKQMMGLN